MRLPASVKRNTYLAYNGDEYCEEERKLKAENFEWDSNHPKSLSALCVEILSANWTGDLKLEELIPKDRELFLQVLKTDVPLQILVDNIKNDIFWKRMYVSKWVNCPVLSETKPWINSFMERFYADFLENLNPRQYDPEKVNKLVKLCGSYIQTLSIRSLIPSDIPDQRITSPEMTNLVTSIPKNVQNKQKQNNKQQLIRDHISLHAALGSLTNLVELHLTYQLCAIGVEYRKDQFQFTINDAKNLARGLEKCTQLKILKITRTDMNCQKVKYILRGLSENQNLETLDFSHCKIGDDGMTSIAKFVSKHEKLRNLILADNVFGPSGNECLAHVLNYAACGLRLLDLRLNNKLGSNGIAHIAVAMARGCNLTSLNISGCGISPEPLRDPPGVWSATSAEKPPTCGDLLARAIGLVKTPLRSLDISVNNIGSPSDMTLSNAICLSYLIDINLKRSGMGSMSMAIAESSAAAQRLRRDEEKGMRFKRSAGRVVQARRVVKGMNIDADPLLLAQQLSARPSIVSVASEDGFYNVQTLPLPTDFSFVPSLKSPMASSYNSSGPPTSRRSSYHALESTTKEIFRATLVRRKSDGFLSVHNHNGQEAIKILISK